MPSLQKCNGFVSVILPGMSSVTDESQRIERIRSTLSSDLEHSLKTTLNSLIGENTSPYKIAKPHEPRHSAHISELIDTLHTYDILGLWRDAEDIVRQEVVRGFVKKVRITTCTLLCLLT